MKTLLLITLLLAGCASTKNGSETSTALEHNESSKAHIKSAQGQNKQIDEELYKLEKMLSLIWVW